jgi:CspA family cold shock protein
MANGTVKRIMHDKGFGFIRDERGQEYFFHRSGVDGNFDELDQDQKVSFEVEDSSKGPRAKDVRAM